MSFVINSSQQALYVHVNQAAKEIESDHPKKEAYMTAAKNFRMPYWDWARKDAPLVPPEALQDGNPVYAFPFPAGTPSNITVST